MSSSDDFLKILKSWKDSEGVIVAVHWTSGMEGVDFSFRAQVLEGDASGIEFGTDEDKGNVTMNVSLVGSTVTKIDKREVDITFRFLGYYFSALACPLKEP